MIWPSICFLTDSGLTRPNPDSCATSTRSSLTRPSRLTETVWTIALIVAELPVSAPRSSSAIARAVPTRQRRAPARHLGGHVERLEHVVFERQIGARDQLASIEVWVFARRVRELVDEALAIELVRGLPDAAARADGHVEIRRVVREAIVRHVVARHDVERGVRAEAVLLHARAHLERDRPAVGVEAARKRAMPIARYVVPMKSSSRVQSRWIGVPRLRVRDHDRLLGLRPIAVAAEAAAEVAHVQVHVLFRDAGDLRRAEARLLRALIADPDVDALVGHEHGRVAGLHASARQIRRGVRRLDDLRGACEGRVDVALFTRTRPGSSRAASSAARMLPC